MIDHQCRALFEFDKMDLAEPRGFALAERACRVIVSRVEPPGALPYSTAEHQPGLGAHRSRVP